MASTTHQSSAIRYRAGFAPSRPALYYDFLTPEPASGKPVLVMIHGAGHTGSGYLVTPDGRPGWAQMFAGYGYPVVVTDWPGTGRSGRMDYAALTGAVICEAYAALIASLDGPCVVLTHSMSGPFGWKLGEICGDRVLAVVGVAPGPPGNIQPVPEILERGDDYVDVQRGAFRRRIGLKEPRAFEDVIVEQKLVGDGNRFPRAAMDIYKQSLVTTPPRVAYERSNIEGSQLRVENKAAWKDKPALVVCADHDLDHTREQDGPIADFLREIGAAAEFCWLPDHGISGNGHMMMLESNNADIAALIADWIETHT